MNTRIKELMIEAGYAAPELAGRANKLVELIVMECADFLDAFNKENMVEEGMDGAYMKQHFGVEE